MSWNKPKGRARATLFRPLQITLSLHLYHSFTSLIWTLSQSPRLPASLRLPLLPPGCTNITPPA